MHKTLFLLRAEELHSLQVDRYLKSGLTADEFLNQPEELRLTAVMLRLNAAHEAQMDSYREFGILPE